MAADFDIYYLYTDTAREKIFCIQNNFPAAEEMAAAVADYIEPGCQPVSCQ